MRDPLLGIYALLAEWRALVDPGVELTAAHLKLAWWREEIERLSRGAPVHPISRYIASLPRAGEVDFTSLEKTLEAPRARSTAHRSSVAPSSKRTRPPCGQSRSQRQRASRVSFAAPASAPAPALAEAVHRAEAALAAAEYLNDAIAGYRRAARFGRVAFPVDELLAANVEDADLGAAEPPLHLQSYLEELRRRAVAILLAGKRGVAALRARADAAPARARGARRAPGAWPAERRLAASARAVSRLEHGAPRCTPAMSGASMESLAKPTAKELPAKLEPVDLSGRTILVTGASGGFGRALAHRMRACGRERRARRPQRRQARPAVR